MQESCTCGSVRGALGNLRPYRDTTLVDPANIREEVVLDDRENSYSGTFTIDQYDTEGHLLVHISGVVSGERISAD